MSARGTWCAATLALALLGGCATVPAGGGTPHGPRAKAAPLVAPLADSATVALWRFDESGGQRSPDDGPLKLDGVAGLDTRSDFGRFKGARVFQHSVDSWIYVPYTPQLDAHRGFSLEAWVRVDSVALHELQVIAARWSPQPNLQTWVFGVTGRNLGYDPQIPSSPGWFLSVLGLAPTQRLLFAYQPLEAGGMHGFFSTAEIPIGRWTHVAVSLDGEVVRLYVDGRMDVQYTTTGPIRPSEAPLVIGNVFDPRHLSSFGSDLRMDPSANVAVPYSFVGAMDELRLSGVARTRFESAPAH